MAIVTSSSLDRWKEGATADRWEEGATAESFFRGPIAGSVEEVEGFSTEAVGQVKSACMPLEFSS